MTHQELGYTPSGALIGRVTGWDGDVPIIEFGYPVSGGPLDSAPSLAGMPSEPPLTEAPNDEASPRTRGLEPATGTDPAHEAAVGASPTPRAAIRG